jgi:putative membrane protein
MKRASQAFTDAQRLQVNEAVRGAEGRTSAEIVPVVATESGRYDRPEDIAGLWLSVVGVVVAWWLLPGGWLVAWRGLAIVVGAVLGGFVIGSAGTANVAGLRRLFTTHAEMAGEVAARTSEMFAARHVHATRAATGLIVYVSLFERMARVQGDSTVLEKVGQDALDALAAELMEKLRGGDVSAALCHVIDLAGRRLGEVLPRPADDTNEIPDELVLID